MPRYEDLPHLTDQQCRESGTGVARYTLYRCVMLVTTLESLLAILLLLYVDLKYITRTTFHANFKIIVIAYFASATIHAVVHAICQGYQFIISFTASDCGLFIPQIQYVISHLLVVYSIFTQVFLQLAVCCERVFATCFVSTYERKNSMIGITLTLIAVLSPLLFEYLIYSRKAFDEATVSFLTVPLAAFHGFNTFFMINIGLCCGGNAVMLSLLLYNRRRREKLSSLSSKYQVRENIFTTQVAASLSILQMSMYIVYAASGVLIRSMQERLFTGNYNLYFSVRIIAYIIPLLTVLLPFTAIYHFRHFRKSKEKTTKAMLNMKSTGTEGMQNYCNMLALQWK